MTKKLNFLRKKIDEIDEQILKLLSQRMKHVFKVGELKKKRGIIPLDSKRWKKVLDSKLKLAKNLELDKKMIKDIYERIHEAALELELLMRKK